MNKKIFLSMVVLFCLLAFPLRVAATQRQTPIQSGPVATLTVTPGGLIWQPLVETSGWILRVASPGGSTIEKSFAAGEQPAFALTGAAGKSLPDGTYIYELWGEPIIPQEVRLQLEAVRGVTERQTLVEELQKAGKLPAGPFYMGGTFAIRNGLAFLPDPLAGEEIPPVQAASPLAPNDEVIPDDLIVQGNACIGRSLYGTNCADGMTFSISPLMLSDLYPRIFFEDTSAEVNPTNDWVILINDTFTGGSEYFAVSDEDGGTVPFKVLAGAPNNAFYVAATGDIGLGTSTPDADLQITSSTNPILAFELTSPAQIWELVANATAFTVYDKTATLYPVVIEAGSPSYSLDIDSTGNVGVGTDSPDARLTVVGDLHVGGFRVASGAPVNSLFLNNSGGVGIGTDSIGAKLHIVTGVSARALLIDNGAQANNLYVTNLGSVGIGTGFPAAKLHVVGGMLADGFTVEASTPANTLHVDSAGRVGIGTDAPSSKLHVAGNMYATGSLILEGFVNERSDAASKTAFTAVNGQDILDRLAAIPISTWSYKDSPGVRHIGPTAQDFRAAYGFGPDDKHLAALDTNGVALAAIQALDEQVKEKDVRIQTLEGQVDELRTQMKALKAGAVAPRVASLWSQLAPLAFGLLGVFAGLAVSRRKQ